MDPFVVHRLLGVLPIYDGVIYRSYLLEKTRVVTQQPEERNYHFFYQLMAAAASDAELAKTLLLDDEEYYYVSQSGVTSIEGVSDLEDFGEVQSAMEIMGMSEEDQLKVFKVVAGILHIGNVGTRDVIEAYTG